MKFEKNEEKLLIYLEGRIDTNNAQDVEKEIFDILSQNDGTIPVFDASALEYISSAGLRVLMKVRKSLNYRILVLEVSPEVYDIFETTGFTDLLDVKKKLKEISVDGCELIGAGAFGNVYRLDEERIVKIYNDKIQREFVESERKTAQDAFLMGIPTAISFNMVKCGNQYGVIFELFNANTIAQLLTKDPSGLQELGAKMAMRLKELHKIEVPKNSGFQSRKKLFTDWLPTLSGAVPEEELKKIQEMIDSIPERHTFLHGDYNSKNIMLQDGEILLIDIGDAAYGHPIFDIAMLLLAYVFLPNSPGLDDNSKWHLLGFDPALAQSLLGIMISTYFGVRTPEEIEAIINQTMAVACLYVAYQGISTGRSTPENMYNYIIKTRLLPMLDGGMKLKLDY